MKLVERNTITSSTEKQSSSAIIVHKPKRTATSTSTIHTKKNKPYRLGAASAGGVGTPTRRCPAATVPADVVFACGFPLLFCSNLKRKNQLAITLLLLLKLLESTMKSSTEKQSSSPTIVRSAQLRVRAQYTQGRTSPTGLARRRQE